MTSSTELRTAPQAERDIAHILRYTRTNWGTAQERVYESILREAFQRIRTFPEIGRGDSEREPEIRELILEHHTIVYSYRNDTVTILRIVNPRRKRR